MHIHTSDQESLNLGFGEYSCNWGVHMCGLYQTEAERDAIVLGFLHAGDVAGDLQLYCPAERGVDSFRSTYAGQFPDCAAHLDSPHRFQVVPAKDLYYPNGTFSPWDMDRGLERVYAESQAQGRRHVRATAEMVWALEAIPGVEHLMAYESRLNYFIPGKPWISVCMYNVTRFSGADLMNVLRTHPYTINGGVITENPYFVNPDDFLRVHAPQFLPPSVSAPR